MQSKPLKKRGPKPLFVGETLKRTQVTIDSLTKRKLMVIGDGNLSAGVRAAADAAYEQYQREKD